MTRKIFRSILIVAITVLMLSLLFIVGVLYDYFGGVQKSRLEAELGLASNGVEAGGKAYLEGLDTDGFRLTLISPDGEVLFDSETNPEKMENHAEREEIKQALESGYGESSRYSQTLMEQTFYRAKRLSDGGVLRISASRMTVLALILGMLRPILIIVAAALVLSMVFASRMSKRIVQPLNSLDLDKPLENNAYDEISPLLTHIEQQQRQIVRQKEKLAASKREFFAVIKNMNEGLVLLNNKNEIISINPAAESFLQTSGDALGKDFIMIERSREISSCIDEAFSSGKSVLETERSGREYQLNFSAIESGSEKAGLVILIFDITDRVFAERNRREFTANVSHELKTPLQTIMGSAELIENGLVKSSDVGGFASKIRQESARLVTLIDDIIRLSQLDEAEDLPRENVDLYELAGSQVALLAPVAEDNGISLKLGGESITVTGVRRLLQEIIYNLCENAIKYNKDGGSVEVSITSEPQEAVIRVSDTGIGIPPEHQARVFERFYRVDKSHSKETGGTGLGLSIVKHAVQYMNGHLLLESKVGEGTTVTVRLPKQNN